MIVGIGSPEVSLFAPCKSNYIHMNIRQYYKASTIRGMRICFGHESMRLELKIDNHARGVAVERYVVYWF